MNEERFEVSEIIITILDCSAILEEDFAKAIRDGNERELVDEVLGHMVIYSENFDQLSDAEKAEEKKFFQAAVTGLTNKLRQDISKRTLSVWQDYKDMTFTVHTVKDKLIFEIVR